MIASTRAVHSPRSASALTWGLTIAAAALFNLSGCTGDPERTEALPAEVKAVSAYGLTLDENATPQQVTFVLLRSIADDVNAAQRRDRAAQKDALRTTYSLAAYSTIEKRLLALLNAATAKKRDGLDADRDRELYAFVRQWAPIVAHYVPSFDPEFQAAADRMSVQQGPQSAHVYYEAWHSATTSKPASEEAVLIDIELAKEPANSAAYWRVARISFIGRSGRLKLLTPSTATAPVS